MALARVAADADGPTAAETLEGIALSPGWSGLAGAARLVSGLTLLGAAWCLGRTWIIKQRWGSPAVPWLLGWSGGFTVVSGLAGVALAMSAPALFPLLAEPQVTELLESVLTGRALAGKIGFALAGLALMVASRYQWKVGGALRRFSPGSAMLGVAMQFIWVDSATMVHPVVGAGFFLWLLGVGGMLFTGRTGKAVLRTGGTFRS